MSEWQVQSEQDRLGEVTAAYVFAEDALLLLGWLDEPLPEEGVAFFQHRRATKGRFRAFAWTAEGGARWFLAAILVEGAGEAAPGQHLALYAPQQRRQTIARLPETFLDGIAFAEELAKHLEAKGAAALAFLGESFAGRTAAEPEEARRFHAALLRALAVEDGVVEILGPLSGRAALLQGWSRSLARGQVEVIAETDRIDERRLVLGHFARGDVPGAQGLVGILGGIEAAAVERLQRFYFAVDGAWRRIEVLANRTALTPADTVSQLRAMLPSVEADPDAALVLRRAARPRYTGHETVSALSVPVAAAVDLAVAVHGAGFYLTGWLLDPAGLVRAVHLRSTAEYDARLDLTWTRVPRADVTKGHLDDARFEGRLDGGDQRHGFTVFVPGETPLEPRSHWFVELDLGEESCAFLPILLAPGDLAPLRRRILESFDIHKPSAPKIIERHVGPLMLAAGGSVAASAVPVGEVGRHRLRDDVETAIVLPILETGPTVNVPLSQFGIHRLAADEQLVLVCPPGAEDVFVALIDRYLDFYGVEAAVLRAEEPIDFCDALELGVRATSAPRLLFLSPTVYGTRSGWVSALREAAGRFGEVAASPTILYEDWSVKFAGIDAVRPACDPGEIGAVSRYAGYARDWVAQREAARVLAGSLECCLIPRAVFEASGGFSPGYALPPAKELDFFLRLRARGLGAVWTPEVEVYALDEPGGEAGEYWAETGRLCDAWSFRRHWGEAVSGAAAVAEVG